MESKLTDEKTLVKNILSEIYQDIKKAKIFLNLKSESIEELNQKIQTDSNKESLLVLSLLIKQIIMYSDQRIPEILKNPKNNNKVTSDEDYTNLERILQKYEAEIRHHVRIEQQMKIYIDNLNEKITTLKRKSKIKISLLKKDNEDITSKMVNLKKELSEMQKGSAVAVFDRSDYKAKLKNIEKDEIKSKRELKLNFDLIDQFEMSAKLNKKDLVEKDNLICDKIVKREKIGQVEKKKIFENLSKPKKIKNELVKKKDINNKSTEVSDLNKKGEVAEIKKTVFKSSNNEISHKICPNNKFVHNFKKQFLLKRNGSLKNVN